MKHAVHACVEFLELHFKLFFELNLKYNFMLHICNLHNFGMISARDVASLFSRLHQIEERVKNDPNYRSNALISKRLYRQLKTAASCFTNKELASYRRIHK